jgi:threonine/homoserine/homoserine lactone efflux protein
MSLSDWFLFAMVCLAGTASPGPSLILLINSVIKDGRRAGVAFGIAHGVGIFLYAALVASGLILLLSIAPWFTIVLEFIGLVFLLFLSISMIRSSIKKEQSVESHPNNLSATSWHHIRNGFLIVFLNPKVAAFYLAIFSQFLDVSLDLESKFIMVITATVIDGCWYIILAFIIAVPKFTNFVNVSANKVEFFLGILLFIVSVFICIRVMMIVF